MLIVPLKASTTALRFLHASRWCESKHRLPLPFHALSAGWLATDPTADHADNTHQAGERVLHCGIWTTGYIREVSSYSGAVVWDPGVRKGSLVQGNHVGKMGKRLIGGADVQDVPLIYASHLSDFPAPQHKKT